MSRKDDFVKFIEENVDFSKASENVITYWDSLRVREEKEKPKFTDNGKLILSFMQEHKEDKPMATAKELGESLLISSRKISGAMRKLHDDGYIDKDGKDPVVYSLTELGKTVEIV